MLKKKQNNKKEWTDLHFKKHHNHFLTVPDQLLGAVAAALQKPSQLLPPFSISNTWEQHGINRISVGMDMLSLFLFFVPCCSFHQKFFLATPFQFSKLHTISGHSCPTAPLTQGLEMYAETPTEGWHDFDDVGSTLSLLFCKPSWLMKDITFSASVLCCFLSDPTACCLMNWMKNMPMETLIQASLNLVKSYQQRFWLIASKYSNS